MSAMLETVRKMREAECAKYVEAYKKPSYGLNARRQQVYTLVTMGPNKGSYLDVGCGRGETIVMAREAGYDPVAGTEIVPALLGGSVVKAWAHSLPWGNDGVDFVTCFDVMEHLLPSDEINALNEIKRVAKDRVAFTISNESDVRDGVELHVNRLPYNVWDALIRKTFETWAVARGRASKNGLNECWECWR